MTNKELQEVIQTKEELDELQSFLFYAEKVWTGKITLRKLVSSAYGMFESKEFEMDTDIKTRVLAVLKEHEHFLVEKIEKM